MKPLILIVCIFFAASSFVQGQVYNFEYAKAPPERKKRPSILGDEPGKTEELRRFFNENLNMKLVADTNLKKGFVIMGCILSASGKPKYFMEGTGPEMYDIKTKIGREFMRVVNLITQWNPAEYLKDGSWIKVELTFNILINIPYKPDDPDGVIFLYA